MGKIIDADEFLYNLTHWFDQNGIEHEMTSGLFNIVVIEGAIKITKESKPTVDAVQVVHCGDCRYIRPTGINGLYECVRMQLATKKDEFCSRGERKGDGVYIVRHISRGERIDG